MQLIEIEYDGWVKGWHYFARGSKNEFHYEKKLPDHEFHTRSITIDFNDDGSIRQVFTYSGCPTRTIKDMADLDYYFKNNR